MQTLPGIDCRGMTVAAAGQCLMERYSAAPPGASFSALLTAYAPGLRMWLLEAGAWENITTHDRSPRRGDPLFAVVGRAKSSYLERSTGGDNRPANASPRASAS